MQRKWILTTLLLVLIASPGLADGPETGTITGVVRDSSGDSLPGILVTLSGQRGDQTIQTDQDGNYRFALLPPGQYELRAELEGFTTGEGSVQVSAGGRHVLDLELGLMTTSEQITVTSEAPMVDKFNVSAGSSVTAEVGEQSAGTTRSYYGVINMLPGVTNDAENGDIQQMRPSVNGSHFADQAVYIDGVDTTFSRLGGSRVILPTTATTEITMESGGASAEYGRAVGSSTNVIVKSGTNTFHGDGVGIYADTDWFADFASHPEFEDNVGQGEGGSAPADWLKRLPAEWEKTTTSYEFSIGGPIKRDKAWFFVAYNDSSTGNTDQTLNKDIVDTSVEYSATIAKVNFQPTLDHHFSASWMDSPVSRNYFNPHSGDEWTTTPHNLSGGLASLNWNYSISSKLFLETKLATQTSNEDKLLAANTLDVEQAVLLKQQDPRFPGNPAMAGPCSYLTPFDECHTPGNNYRIYSDIQDDGVWNNGWVLDNGFGLNEYPRDQVNTALTAFAGANHELKFGLDWQQVEWLQDVHRTGYYWSSLQPWSPVEGGFNSTSPTGFNNCGLAVGNICNWIDYNPADMVEQGRSSSDSKNKNLTLYVRDRFSVGDHWTFNLGLRGSKQENTNDIGRKVVDTTTVEPRLSASYDIKGDGRMLATLNLGRYYTQLNQQQTNRWLMDGWTGWNAESEFWYCSEDDVALGFNHFFPGGEFCQFTGVGYTLPIKGIRPGEQFRLEEEGYFDIDLEPYFKDEIILGFEWQFSNNWAFDAKGIYWELGNMIMNTAQRDPDGNIFNLSANAKDMPGMWRSLGQVPEDVIAGFREPVKEYTALQLQLNRRFSNGWAVFNNLTFAKLETTGSGAWWDNSSSSYGEDLGTLLTAETIDTCQVNQANRSVPVDCWAALGPHLGQPLSTVNRLGRDGLGGGIGTSDGEYGSGVDRPFIWKTFGFKEWSIGKHSLTLGGLFSWQDGIGWGRGEMIDVPVPNDYLNSTWVPVEANGTRRLPSFYDLNLSGNWGFPLGSRLNGAFRLEVTNVTNEQGQVDVNIYGEPRTLRRTYQRPRQLRTTLSIRF